VTRLLPSPADPAAPADPLARAFNRGSDARLAGLPRSANPYPHDDPCRALWRQGWQDVATWWAVEALWPHADLPEVAP
jgi:ribosome modulation factor